MSIDLRNDMLISMNRPALGGFPPANWNDIISGSLLKVAPKGLDQLFTMMYVAAKF